MPESIAGLAAKKQTAAVPVSLKAPTVGKASAWLHAFSRATSVRLEVTYDPTDPVFDRVQLESLTRRTEGLGRLASDAGGVSANGRMKDEREAVTAEELLISNAAEIDALVEVLVRKGLVTREELLDEIRAMKQRMHLGEREGSA